MKFRSSICFALAASILVEGAGWTQSSRNRSAGVGSLLEMKCQGEGLSEVNSDWVVVNRRNYTAVGSFGFSGYSRNDYIPKSKLIEISCNLAARNQSPIYKTLTMTVGSDDNNVNWRVENSYSARLRITTYLDGDPTGSAEIGFRDLKRFSLNIDGVRSVAFSVECLPSKHSSCPNLFILEDKLIK